MGDNPDQEAYDRLPNEICEKCSKSARDWYHIPISVGAGYYRYTFRCDDHPPDEDEDGVGEAGVGHDHK